MYTRYYQSPLGLLKIVANELGILEVSFAKERSTESSNHHVNKCLKQLDEYFLGKRKSFELSLFLEGTEFRKRVWQELMNIPYGELWSYKDIAIKVNNPRGCQAVGGANKNNPIGIIIPCHRVIGKSGELVGYNGGLDKKEWLINHENKNR